MKKLYTFLFSLVLISGLSAQNLVLNPSFETVNSGSLKCSWYLSAAEYAAAVSNWTVPSNGSTDIFHTSLATSCYCSPFSTHASANGPQAPRTGSSMTALCTYGNGGCSPNYREYAQGQLSSPMVPGQDYCIEFYVSMADYNTRASNNIGVYFATSAQFQGTMCPMSVTPQLNYTSTITDATNWTLISFTYTATAAYDYFIIGNFYTDAATSTTATGGSRTVTRYYLDDVSIQLCSNPNPTITVNDQTICEGESATLTATSDIAGTTFLWSTGGTGSSITVSPASTTTYTVTGTDPVGGGTGTTSATVTVNPLPTVSASASPSTICSGNSSTLTASGASTYVWSTGATGSSISVSPGTSTTYTVTGTSAAGCSNTASVLVTVASVPTVTASASPGSICPGGSSTLTAGGATTYTWSTGGTGSSISVSPASTTTYTVTGSSGAGCSNTATVDVIVNTAPTISVTNQTICDGETATLTASGAAIYSWSTGGNTPSISVSPSSTTTYTVTGTNAVGCTGTTTATVTVNPLPNIGIAPNPTTICAGQSCDLFPAGGVSYVWSTGGTGNPETVSPMTSTTYYVTGTDANGCTGEGSFYLMVMAGPTVTATGATICEGDIANITASGASTYEWDNTMTGSSINVTPVITTTYTVTGTDAAGCIGTATSTVIVNALPTISVADAMICNGETATLSASGGTSYNWSSGGTGVTENVTPGSTTTYYVTGTDGNGCSNIDSAQVIVNQNPTINVTSTSDYCDGNNGTATAIAGSGLAPYTYSWNTSPAQNTPTADNLPAGNYIVTVTDDNGCTETATVTVDPLAGFTLTSDSDPEHCDQLDGLAQVFVSGAQNTPMYSWSHNAGLNSDLATGLSAGTYTVTVDDGQCIRTIDIDVSEMQGPTAGFILNPSTINMDDPTTNIIDQSINATSWYYEMGDGNTETNSSFTYSYLETGEYTIMQIVSDDYGCIDTAYQTIVVNESFTIYIPNAFSPNGDGKNDIFHPFGTGIDANTWHMRIYDRWGRTVFVSTDYNQGWDGGFEGDVNNCSQAVYSYYIFFKTTQGKDKEFYGRVTKLP
ncbi:MAG: hypothetical protein C0592_11080 [Marinilabiliales bacterium]|nr:MAG: hypothetical protein C0592_11080 [Marinilabiliales bacterium]